VQGTKNSLELRKARQGSRDGRWSIGTCMRQRPCLGRYWVSVDQLRLPWHTNYTVASSVYRPLSAESTHAFCVSVDQALCTNVTL